MTAPENTPTLAPSFGVRRGHEEIQVEGGQWFRPHVATAICLGGAFLSFHPVAASATILSAEAIVTPLNEDAVQDRQRSRDPARNDFVDASASGAATAFGGDTVETQDATASTDYHSGALTARGEATSLSDAAGGGASVGIARLFDEITFTVSPTATSRDVTFLWQVDRTIVGADGASVFGFFQVRDAVSTFGNTLINDQFNGQRAFTDSGTYRNQATLTLPDVPTSEAPVLRLEYLLRAQARIFSVLVDGGASSDFRSALADAGNTAYLNIITPEGISFEGGGEGFLSEAPDLRAPAIIPVPASGLLLSTVIVLCRVGKRRSARGA